MAKRTLTELDSWEFSAEEDKSARTFSQLQLQYLQTELTAATLEKALASPLTCTADQYLQQQEFSRGKMYMLQYLIEVHTRLNEKEV